MANGKTACEKQLVVQFDGLFIPFVSKASCKPTSSTDEARLHESWQHDAFRNLHGKCITCGGRMVRRFGKRGLRRPREPVRLRCSHQTVQTPGSRTRRKPVVSMCRRTSEALRSSSTPTRRNAREEETLKEEVDAILEEENG